MTVAELMAELSGMDPTATVLIKDYNYDPRYEFEPDALALRVEDLGHNVRIS